MQHGKAHHDRACHAACDLINASSRDSHACKRGAAPEDGALQALGQLNALLQLAAVTHRQAVPRLPAQRMEAHPCKFCCTWTPHVHGWKRAGPPSQPPGTKTTQSQGLLDGVASNRHVPHGNSKLMLADSLLAASSWRHDKDRCCTGQAAVLGDGRAQVSVACAGKTVWEVRQCGR